MKTRESVDMISSHHLTIWKRDTSGCRIGLYTSHPSCLISRQSPYKRTKGVKKTGSKCFTSEIAHQLTSTRVRQENVNPGHRVWSRCCQCSYVAVQSPLFCGAHTKAFPHRHVPQYSICRTCVSATHVYPVWLSTKQKKTNTHPADVSTASGCTLEGGTSPPDPCSTCLPCRLAGNRFTTRLLLLFCVWHTLHSHYVNRRIRISKKVAHYRV